MRVVVKIQRKVMRAMLLLLFLDDTIQEVFCLLHPGAHDHHLHTQPQHLAMLLVDVLARLVDGEGRRHAEVLDPKALSHELLERFRLLQIRWLVVPQHGHLGELRHGEALGDAPVGQKHQLLDDPVRCTVRLQVVACGNPILAVPGVEDHLRLADRHGSARQAAMPHLAADFVEQQDVVLDLLPRVAAVHQRPVFLLNVKIVDDVLSLLVVQTTHGGDGRLCKPGRRVLDQLARSLAEAEEGREGQLWLVRIQGAEIVAEAMRQHWQHPPDEVDRGGTTSGLLIRNRAELQEVSDVGDVHSHLDLTLALQVLHVNGIIQVLRRGRVDGEDPLLSQIHPGSSLRLEVSLGRLDDLVHLIKLFLAEVDIVAVEFVRNQGMALLRFQAAGPAQTAALQAAKRMLAGLVPHLDLHGPQLKAIQLPRQPQGLGGDVVNLE
mmetsp:Transcript_25044/g.59564  ORF Transcript_25044/g.59564 Transcript_25044/m.59564 type:complete len:435 (-) Transcript_25044:241-1545(-)